MLDPVTLVGVAGTVGKTCELVVYRLWSCYSSVRDLDSTMRSFISEIESLGSTVKAIESAIRNKSLRRNMERNNAHSASYHDACRALWVPLKHLDRCLRRLQDSFDSIERRRAGSELVRRTIQAILLRFKMDTIDSVRSEVSTHHQCVNSALTLLLVHVSAGSSFPSSSPSRRSARPKGSSGWSLRRRDDDDGEDDDDDNYNRARDVRRVADETWGRGLALLSLGERVLSGDNWTDSPLYQRALPASRRPAETSFRGIRKLEEPGIAHSHYAFSASEKRSIETPYARDKASWDTRIEYRQSEVGIDLQAAWKAEFKHLSRRA